MYVFHIPPVSFISRFLHPIEPQITVFARKKSIHLLVPYASFVLVVTLMRIPHVLRHAVTLHRLDHAAFVLLWEVQQ